MYFVYSYISVLRNLRQQQHIFLHRASRSLQALISEDVAKVDLWSLRLWHILRGICFSFHILLSSCRARLLCSRGLFQTAIFHLYLFHFLRIQFDFHFAARSQTQNFSLLAIQLEGPTDNGDHRTDSNCRCWTVSSLATGRVCTFSGILRLPRFLRLPMLSHGCKWQREEKKEFFTAPVAPTKYYLSSLWVCHATRLV